MSEEAENTLATAKAYFKKTPPGEVEQTRIALFLQGVKSLNTAILAKVELQSLEWLPYKHLHAQYFKEMELSTLIGKATTWSSNPMVYMQATNLNFALWQETEASGFVGGFFKPDGQFYQYLALSHAFMSVIRFLPLLPTSLPLDTPFLSALKEIEEENGRQIQTQIRLLKETPVDLSLEEKEAMVTGQHEIVEGLFCRLLREITNAN